MIFIGFSFFHIIATGSRKGLIMPLVAIGIFLIVRSGFDANKIIKNVCIFFLGVVFLIYVLIQNPELSSRLGIVVRMILGGSALDESSALRMAFIKLAKSMFISRPLLGCGINTFASQCMIKYGKFYYSHNNFFEILSGVGAIGFILYYWFYGYSIYKFCILKNKNDFYILGLSIWLTLTFFEYGIVTYSIQLYPILLIILAISYRRDILEKGELDVSRM